jgi:hypothetical protein
MEANRERNEQKKLDTLPRKIEILKMETQLEQLKKKKREMSSTGTTSSGGFGLGGLINEDALKVDNKKMFENQNEQIRKDSEISYNPDAPSFKSPTLNRDVKPVRTPSLNRDGIKEFKNLEQKKPAKK